MQVAIGLDFGSTTLSAVAVDQAGQQFSNCSVAHHADITGLPPNHHEQDPRLLFQKASELLRRMIESSEIDSDSITCLGITGQMHGVLLVDESLQPLTNLITWQDRRVLNKENGTTFINQIDHENSAETGCQLRPGYGAVTLAALRRSKQLPGIPFKCCTIMDWFAACLVQRIGNPLELFTDRANAGSLGIFNLKTDAWDKRLLDALKLDTDWFPFVKECGSAVGEIRPDLAVDCGLSASTLVCVPTGDHQAAVLGSGGMTAGTIHINIGTGGQISWPSEIIHTTPGLDTRYLPEKQLMAVGAGQVGGRAFEWLARTAQSWMESFGKSMLLEEVYSHISKQMQTHSDLSGGLSCLPFFSGTRMDPEARGIFAGISEQNFSVGNVAHAIVNGIADSFHKLYSDFGPGTTPERMITSGNAIRKIPEIPHRLAEKFETSVLTPQSPETAATGAAILAGVKTGLWDSLPDACGLVKLTELSSPK